ncbi:MAG: phytoene desaturase family protein [Halanaerobiales bacterium]
MERKRVIIIGAGIAGLSAASYLQRNGYDTEIFEAHSLPGGLCTSWKRGEYTFDYCIYWLMGTKKETGFDIIWDELGALVDEEGREVPICNLEEFNSVQLSDGDCLTFYADTGRLEEELLRVAPEDRRRIQRFIRDLRSMARLKIPIDTEKWGKKEWFLFLLKHMGPALKLREYSRLTFEEFTRQWRNGKLQEAFRALIPPDWSATAFVMGLAMQDSQSAGYPIGGSLAFARNIERRYLALGGKINYNCRVEKILVEDGRAVGIRLASGEEFFADDIISAADGYTTIYKLLEGQYISEEIKEIYETYPLFPSTIHLGFGVAKDLSDFPARQMIFLPEPLELPDGSSHQYLSLNIYNFDPTLAPEGKTVVTVLLNTRNDTYWQDLAGKEPVLYQKEKDKMAEMVMEILEKRIPGFRAAVEVIDVSTPHTVIRYTGNWRGSFEGFAPTPETLSRSVPKELPGLSNFYMVGQWTEPGGGLPPAGLQGRNLAREFCVRDGKEFRSR